MSALPALANPRTVVPVSLLSRPPAPKVPAGRDLGSVTTSAAALLFSPCGRSAVRTCGRADACCHPPPQRSSLPALPALLGLSATPAALAHPRGALLVVRGLQVLPLPSSDSSPFCVSLSLLPCLPPSPLWSSSTRTLGLCHHLGVTRGPTQGPIQEDHRCLKGSMAQTVLLVIPFHFFSPDLLLLLYLTEWYPHLHSRQTLSGRGSDLPLLSCLRSAAASFP